MIKNLLFDMGGVIFRQDTAEAFRLHLRLVFGLQILHEVGQHSGLHGQLVGWPSHIVYNHKISVCAGRKSKTGSRQQNEIVPMRDRPKIFF